MYTVLKTRKGIPFFCQKSEADFRQDPYERYHDMVLRQTALHLADELWGGYSFQLLLDWLLQETEAIFVKTKQQPTFHFVEIGCGVGRLIGTLAQHYPYTNCWGIDYSYQMLKRAKEYWLSDQSIEFDWSDNQYSFALFSIW